MSEKNVRRLAEDIFVEACARRFSNDQELEDLFNDAVGAAAYFDRGWTRINMGLAPTPPREQEGTNDDPGS